MRDDGKKTLTCRKGRGEQALTLGSSPSGRGKKPSPPAPLPQGERGASPHPGVISLWERKKALTPGPSARAGEGREDGFGMARSL